MPMTMMYHPLHNDLVLEILFSYLLEDDLKNCRLVCWSWWKKATRALQKSCRCIVFGGLYKLNMFQIRPDLDRIKLFLSAMEKSELVPFVNFELRPSMFASQNEELLINFLHEHGPIIQRLIINLAYESADSFSPNCLPNVNLTNLTALDFSNFLRGELRPSLKTSLLTHRKNLLKSILAAAPNLESLSLWCDNENVAWPGDAFEILLSEEFRNLLKLKISFPCTNDQLLKLKDIQLPILTEFIFVLRDPPLAPENFLLVLKTLRKSLKSLKIVDLQCRNEKTIQFPILEELTTLEVEGTFYGDGCRLSFGNFCYNKQFPRLKKMHLVSTNADNMDVVPLFFHSTCQTLLELGIELSVGCVDGSILQQIPNSFPNLKIVSLLFTHETKHLLTTMFDSLKTILEELELDLRKCEVNLDEEVTGFSRTTLEKSKALTVDDDSLLDGKIKSGVSDLQNLKTLVIKGQYRFCTPGEFAFTDISAFYGILKLPKLMYLSMWRSGFSDKCIDELSRKCHFVMIPCLQ